MEEAPARSVVIPVYNEAENVGQLHAELLEVLSTLPGESEVIYVNDGSTDATREALCVLPGARVIDLTRRYGQSSALDAGFSAARGRYIISLDGDGQNDPRDIPKLIAHLEAHDLDVVAGWRKHRKDKAGIRVLTRLGRLLRNSIINDRIHDSGCTLRVYRREALETLELYGEMHRYIVALLRWRGFRIGEVMVNDRPRSHGTSKYGYGKALRGFIDLLYVWFIYKYSDRPLHLFGYLGLGAFFISALSLCTTVFQFFAFHTHVNRNGWFFLTFFFLLGGILLFSFGIVIDLLIRLHYQGSTKEKRYYIRSVQTNPS